jgi:cell division protein FtsZ
MAFKLADDVLRQGVSGISELLTETGLINVDFAHIRHVMSLGGGSLMSIGNGEGVDKAKQALEQALHHPMLDEISLDTAAGIIANFSGGDDLTFSEVADTLSYLHQETGNQAEIIPGVINDPNLTNRAQVILIITGLGALPIEQAFPGAEKYLAEYAEPKPKLPVEHKTSSGLYNAQVDDQPLKPPAYSFTPSQPMMATTNLDVPAFLRKRVRG